MLDKKTGLDIGNPEVLPFSDLNKIDIEQLITNIRKRKEFGIASISGIRQVFDTTNGDDKPDFFDGTSTSITEAAKVYIAIITKNFADLVKNKSSKKKPVIVVGIDTRHSGPAICDIAIRTLIWCDVDVKYIFVSPITRIAAYSRETADGFLYISASHNPIGYNGLKLGLSDGRVLSAGLAQSFIEKYESELTNPAVIRDVIVGLNGVSSQRIEGIFRNISVFGEESEKIYSELCDSIITGSKDTQEVKRIKDDIKSKISSMKLWIGLDPNGGARRDKEYLESWGFNIVQINSEYRKDMNHQLAPTPDATKQAQEALSRMTTSEKKIIAFFVFDTDGDRKNVVLIDKNGDPFVPGVQKIFALDVLASILDIADKGKLVDGKYGIVVNDASSSLMEQICSLFNIALKRTDTGEAAVAGGGEILSKEDTEVIIMGEASNGGTFTLDFMVREPIHTIRTIINLITRPNLIKILMEKINIPDNCPESILDWHSPQNIQSLFYNILNTLPTSIDTDFFTKEGEYRAKPIDQHRFKQIFDDYFPVNLWPKIKKELSDTYEGRLSYEFTNYEGTEELRGKGNRKTQIGGYKIEFFFYKKDMKYLIGWIWFRLSLTEKGLMRRGVSLSHIQSDPRTKQMLEKKYKVIYNLFTNAIEEIENLEALL
ncbi:MAG: hypothetical protein Q7J67_09195 [bacterium]|nr:hypothetical protein [bacterium]